MVKKPETRERFGSRWAWSRSAIPPKSSRSSIRKADPTAGPTVVKRANIQPE
jgi:hypothetical protein